ncbi:xanthine dehydrogenase accessory factor [Kineococcus aurantiacus]|uniref:Xanthine dehydrogenase accessory factor n=1 Tax=Kineococcus aurantiacus TaxID=37633 RepID=A0A7Y9J2T3_9ACTN|nr:xanthine dehydrogenase accessory factor [Kineococcus aurantiacus]
MTPVRDVLDVVAGWVGAGRRVAVATVVRTWESAPRPAGAALAVAEGGEVAGSVSGGCVEAAVHELACAVLADGEPRRARYGVSDDDALAAGLTCGGVLEVFVALAAAPVVEQLSAAVDERRHVALVTALTGPGTRQLLVDPVHRSGSLGSARLDDAVTDDVRGLLAAGTSGVLRVGADGGRRPDDLEVFVEVLAPAPRLVVFGAIDFAAAVARIGGFLGFHVTVCDARPVFTTRLRFPDVDELVVDWPHRYLARTSVDADTALCVLTHDPKFDVPLLEVALRGPAGYVGVMGSRRTHADRLERLRAAGLTEQELSRLRSPVGLDLGARTPEETAVSIAAEIVAARWGGTGRPLRTLRGRIHHDPFTTVVSGVGDLAPAAGPR